MEFVVLTLASPVFMCRMNTMLISKKIDIDVNKSLKRIRTNPFLKPEANVLTYTRTKKLHLKNMMQHPKEAIV